MTKKKETLPAVQHFQPLAEMVQFKQKLLVRMEDSPIYSIANVTPEVAYEVMRDRRVKEWAKLDGFNQWLSNKNETREKVAGLLDLALDRARSILENPEAPASVQAGLIKTIIDLSAIKVTKEKDSSKAIDVMDEKQLEDFMKKAGYVRLTANAIDEKIPQIDVSPSNDTLIKDKLSEEELDE